MPFSIREKTTAFFVAVALGTYLCTPLVDSNLFELRLFGRLFFSGGIDGLRGLELFGATSAWYPTTLLPAAIIGAIESAFDAEGLLYLKLILVCAAVGVAVTVFSLTSRSIFFGCVYGSLFSLGALTVNSLNDSLFAVPLALLLLFCLSSSYSGKRTAGVFALSLLSTYVSLTLNAFIVLLVVAVFLLPEKLSSRIITFLALLLPQFMPPMYGSQLLWALNDFYASVLAAFFLQEGVSTIFTYQISFLFIAWVLFVITVVQSRGLDVRRATAAELFILLITTFFALVTDSFAPMALVVIFFALARVTMDVSAPSAGPLVEGLLRFQQKLQALPFLGSIWVLLCLAIVCGVKYVQVGEVSYGALPVSESEFLVKQKADKLFLPPEVSAYVLHQKLSAGQSVKGGLLGSALKASSVGRYIALKQAFRLLPGWSKFVSELSPDAVLCRTTDALCVQLLSSADWRLAMLKGRKVSDEINRDDFTHLSWAVFLSK